MADGFEEGHRLADGVAKEVDAELAQGGDVGLYVDRVGVDEACDFGWWEKETGYKTSTCSFFGVYV